MTFSDTDTRVILVALYVAAAEYRKAAAQITEVLGEDNPTVANLNEQEVAIRGIAERIEEET